MAERRDQNRRNLSKRHNETQQGDQSYYADDSGSRATQNLPSADNRLFPYFQQQALPHLPEERTRSRERSRLRKDPPKSKTQPADSPSQPYREFMVDIPLHDVSSTPEASRPSTRTAPDGPAFAPTTTWVSSQRGRSPNPVPSLQPNLQHPNRILGQERHDVQSNADSAFLAAPPGSTSRPRSQRYKSFAAPTSHNTIPPTPAIPSSYIQTPEEEQPSQNLLPSNNHSRTLSHIDSDQNPAQSHASSCASAATPTRDALRPPLQIDSRPFHSAEGTVQNVREAQQAQKSSQTSSESQISKSPPQKERIIRSPPNGMGHHAIGMLGRQEPTYRPHIFNDDPNSGNSSQEHIVRINTSLDDPVQGLISSPVVNHSGAHFRPHHTDTHSGYFDKETQSFLNRFVARLHIKSALIWSHQEFFHPYAIFSMLPPYSYQLPGRYYKINALVLRSPDQDNTAILDTYIDPCLDSDDERERSQDEEAEKRAKGDQFNYLDIFRRKMRDRFEDRYVDPIDGRLGMLVVQATTAIYNLRNRTTWRRTYIGNISPYFVRLAYWPTATMKKGPNEWKRKQWLHVGLRWLPSCIGILVLLYGPTDAGGQIRNNGYYDPFPYRLWTYPKVARNVRENRKYGQHNPIAQFSKRITKPRMLCFLNAVTDTNPNGVLHQRQWGSQDPTYIFVSYTGVGQFERRCAESQAKSSCRCRMCLISFADAEALHKIAKIAAKEAGVPAYWTDQCCMSKDPDEFSTDIYSISDVVRSCHSLVIIVGESGGGRAKSIPKLLGEYGRRMWTFPEAILAPPKKDILVYRRGEENRPRRLARLDIAQREQGPDDLRVRELIDHYDGTMSLSRLELVVIALECLLARETSMFAEGDLTYALMGLLRLRPTTDRSDSAFQAFARLSLANDSDKLLERMICLLPKHQAKSNHQDRHYWAIFDDFWETKLWDIDPNCQISAISADDTVIIDGAYAATIHWESFHRVAITTKETWSRLISRSVLRGVPGFVSIGALLYYIGQKNAAIALLVIAGIIVIFSPFLVLHIYGGKVWSTQPWLFGFEGHMPIKEIETKIFGFPQNRLTWTPHGSSLSEHRPRQSFLKNECRGIDPKTVSGNARVQSLVENGPIAEYGESRVFTLVDTNTMTVTLFEAERPPAVALLCGSEGGMQRAVMCSYDWPTQTLYRETVLRMETRVLEKMSRVGRVRFGLRRNVKGKPETWPRSIDLTQSVQDD